MSDFFRHIQVPVFNDILDGLHKPFTQQGSKRFVPFRDLVSDRIAAVTPIGSDPNDTILAALIALREAAIVVCQFNFDAGGVIVYSQPTRTKLDDADFAAKVFSDQRVANSCINMLEASHVSRKAARRTQ